MSSAVRLRKMGGVYNGARRLKDTHRVVIAVRAREDRDKDARRSNLVAADRNALRTEERAILNFAALGDAGREDFFEGLTPSGLRFRKRNLCAAVGKHGLRRHLAEALRAAGQSLDRIRLYFEQEIAPARRKEGSLP